MATRLVFFDVDKTLVKGYTGFYTNIDLIRSRVIRKRHLPKALWYMCFANYYRDRVIEKMYLPAIADMAGSSIHEIMRIGRQCVDRWIRPRLYADALSTIRGYQSCGIPVVLLSSGPQMTVTNLATFLGMDDAHSIGPVVEAGKLVNRLQTPICYKEGKLILASRAATQRGVALQECAFYTDSIADIALLEQVGEPMVVNPDRELARVAAARRWPIHRWRTLLAA